MVADFMQNRHANLPDKLRFAIANHLDRLLKNIDHIRHRSRILHIANRPWPAYIQPQQEPALANSGAAKLRFRGKIPNFNRNLLEKLGKLVRQLFNCRLDQLPELRFAHAISHR